MIGPVPPDDGEVRELREALRRVLASLGPVPYPVVPYVVADGVGVAVVGGYPAAVLHRILRAALRDGAYEAFGVPRELQPEVEWGVRAIELAAAHWERARELPPDHRAAPEVTVRSPWMSTAEVAEALGVSERRVRQIAERLGGRRENGVWLFERAAVEQEIKRRARDGAQGPGAEDPA